MVTLLVLGICFLDKVFDLNWLICVENSLDMMVCPMGLHSTVFCALSLYPDIFPSTKLVCHVMRHTDSKRVL